MRGCSFGASFSPSENATWPVAGILTVFSGEAATVKLSALQQGTEGTVGFTGREVCCDSFDSGQWQHLRGGGVFALLSTVLAGITQHQPGGSARRSALQSTTYRRRVVMLPFYARGAT